MSKSFSVKKKSTVVLWSSAASMRDAACSYDELERVRSNGCGPTFNWIRNSNSSYRGLTTLNQLFVDKLKRQERVFHSHFHEFAFLWSLVRCECEGNENNCLRGLKRLATFKLSCRFLLHLFDYKRILNFLERRREGWILDFLMETSVNFLSQNYIKTSIWVMKIH